MFKLVNFNKHLFVVLTDSKNEYYDNCLINLIVLQAERY